MNMKNVIEGFWEQDAQGIFGPNMDKWHAGETIMKGFVIFYLQSNWRHCQQLTV